MFSPFNLKKLFRKNNQPYSPELPANEQAIFELMIDRVKVGTLSCAQGAWTFFYAPEFKEVRNRYNLITGFPDLDKTYHSDTLWPFFLIRIPGLNQPAIRETIEIENIDAKNEVALLKRFGMYSISNPYQLRPAN